MLKFENDSPKAFIREVKRGKYRGRHRPHAELDEIEAIYAP